MTCIVGIVKNGAVWMGADSAAVEASHYLDIRREPKVFKNGQYLIGYTSSFRMGQILQFAELPLLQCSGDKNIFQFMVKVFVPAVRDALRCGGWLKSIDNREQSGQFLVGVAGQLFIVDDDFNVGSSCHGFDAVGSGVTAAKAAMFAMGKAPRPPMPEKRLVLALQAAEAFCATVRAPFHIDVLKCVAE